MKKIFLLAMTIALTVGSVNASPPGITAKKKTTVVEEARITVTAVADVGLPDLLVPLPAADANVLANNSLLKINGAPCPTGQQLNRIKDEAIAGESNKAPCPLSKVRSAKGHEAITVTANLQVPVDVGKTTPTLFAHTAGKKVNAGRNC